MISFLNLLTADTTGTVLILGGLAYFLYIVGAVRHQCRDDITDDQPVSEARQYRSE